MPIVNKSRSETLPHARYLGCAYGDYDQTVVTSASSVSTPDRVRRVRPTCLVCNPTGRNCFAVQEWQLGLYKENLAAPCTPNPNGRVDLYTTFEGYGTRGTVLAAPTLPDWALGLRLRIKNQMVNLAVASGEYRETCSMFSDAAKTFHTAYKQWREWKANPVGTFARRVAGLSMKKGSRPTSKSVLDTTAQKILLADFGIVPLMGDVYDSIRNLEKIHPLKRRIVDFHSGENHLVSVSGGYSHEGTYRISTRAIFYLTMASNVMQSGGFTGGNPLEVAWELTPFSFVLDWLIPVGDYLASLDALNGVADIVGTVTTRSTQNYWKTVVPYSTPSGSVSSVRSYHWMDDRCVRDAHTSVPMASVPFRYEPSDSFKSVLNGTALMRQLRRNI